ncbi:MAG: CDP-alcohol phosphatidyltransferase family protein [Bacteroidales bacterium]|nr:CDP-alcohol phosphatidyltransferase family protein [Bacteroidales bacterium]
MIIRNQIPNAVTLLNLLCGSVAVTFAFSGDLVLASWFIILAAIFDFLDGMLARALKAYSAIGAQLDSLSDVVSFGLAPAVIMYVLLRESMGIDTYPGEFQFIPFIAFLLVLAAAYRLARFNAAGTGQQAFRGLPTPATGLFIASLPFILFQQSYLTFLKDIIGNQFTLLGIVIFLSILMVSRLQLLSLKFKSFRWQGNQSRYFLVILAIILLFFFQTAAFPFIIITYILLSLVSRPAVL